MNCASVQELMEQFLDQELDANLHAQVRDHVTSCGACAEVFSQGQQLQSDIRSQAPYYNAPAVLENSVRDALRQAAFSEAPAPRSTTAGWRWAALAASVLLVASLGWNVTLLRSRTADREVIAQDVLSSHVRSMIGTHLLDVVSSDQHTVKPWFDGKLDFSPTVKDLAAQDFPLLGGRIEYLSGRTAAALVYGRRKHVINLFVWPSAASEDRPIELARNGYNLVHWSEGQMTYWAVSDIPAVELQDFKRLYQQ